MAIFSTCLFLLESRSFMKNSQVKHITRIIIYCKFSFLSQRYICLAYESDTTEWLSLKVIRDNLENFDEEYDFLKAVYP